MACRRCVIARTAAVIFVPTGSIVVRERPDAAKVAHFRQMLRNGSKPPPIKIMKYPDALDGFDRPRWYFYDGDRRLAAARAEGAVRIAAVAT